MSLYSRLVNEKKRLSRKALRFPKTNQELLDRKRWERIYLILTRRYEYGLEGHLDDVARENAAHSEAHSQARELDDMRRQDQFDEIATIKRTE